MAKFRLLFSGRLKYKAEPEYMTAQYKLNLLRVQPFENLLEIENSKKKGLKSMPLPSCIPKPVPAADARTEIDCSGTTLYRLLTGHSCLPIPIRRAAVSFLAISKYEHQELISCAPHFLFL